ncbi:hypothetical protein [Streptomyces sp. NPDC002685]|uniref:hypothetical protein n=1 Tax=Streptomyces sp. NPDC002685 TaxID=3154540 RepID=UPI003331EDD8
MVLDDRQVGGDDQVAQVEDRIVLGLGTDQGRAVEVGAGEQLLQCEQGTRLPGVLLPVDFLEACDICP